MMHWDGSGWGWGMGFGWLVMVLFWVLVIAGIAFFIKMMAGFKKMEETALDILQKRYAKGEITEEEYERTKEELLNKGKKTKNGREAG